MSTLSGGNDDRSRPEVCADDVTRDNVESMRRVEEEALARRSGADRIAAFVAGFCGSMPFVWLHVAWFCAWLTLNSWPGAAHFDPYPFTFLTLIVSLEAIFLSAFILIVIASVARQSMALAPAFPGAILDLSPLSFPPFCGNPRSSHTHDARPVLRALAHQHPA